MDFAIFFIGLIGFGISLVMLIMNAVKKKPKKKSVMILAICLVLMIVGLSMPTNKTDKEPKTTDADVDIDTEPEKEEIKLTDKEKELLSKSYSDLDSGGRTEFAEILDKFSKLPKEEQEKYKSDIERLKSERDEWVKEQEKAEKEKEEKEWKEFVANNTKTLSAGEHFAGEHIDSGLYDVIFEGSGNFIIHSSDGALLANEVAGTSHGISKFRIILIEGAKIELKSLSATFTPVKSNLIPYEEFEIYSGYWNVGNDVTKGRYKVTPSEGSGNFIIHSKNNQVKVNEILGGSHGVNEVVVNLEDGDLIDIRGINKVKFVPED